LKRAAAAYLPSTIIHRRKSGFMMPVAAWLTNNMRESIEDFCSPAALSATGLFDVTFARKLIDDHLENRRDNRKQVYALLCFMAWFRRYKPHIA
jgi:asparagine synthase (glutamine-hydrolysing)